MGLAKSIFMRMPTEGVDLSQPGTTDAWMDDSNSRPREKNDPVGRGLRIPPTHRKYNPPSGPLRSAISAAALPATRRLLLTLWLRKPATASASVSKRTIGSSACAGSDEMTATPGQATTV